MSKQEAWLRCTSCGDTTPKSAAYEQVCCANMNLEPLAVLRARVEGDLVFDLGKLKDAGYDFEIKDCGNENVSTIMYDTQISLFLQAAMDDYFEPEYIAGHFETYLITSDNK